MDYLESVWLVDIYKVLFVEVCFFVREWFYWLVIGGFWG